MQTTSFAVPLRNIVIRGSNNTPARLDTVIIECSVTANPPANIIIWMKRTSERILQALINTRQTSITHQLTYTPSGPVSRSILTINNVEASDNGDYICEASNGPSPSSVSANFTICVIGKCQLTLELYNETCMLTNASIRMIIYYDCAISMYEHNTIIAQGSVVVTSHDHRITHTGRAELNCSACPTLTPLFMWNFTQRGAQEMETVANRSQLLSSQFTVRNGQKSQTLIINDAQWRHAGAYKCIAAINGTIIEAQTILDVVSMLYRVTIIVNKN